MQLNAEDAASNRECICHLFHVDLFENMLIAPMRDELPYPNTSNSDCSAQFISEQKSISQKSLNNTTIE